MPTDATPTRRRLISSALGLAGAAAFAKVGGPALFGVGDRLEAAGGPALREAATAAVRAERLGVVRPPPGDGKFAFPVEPGTNCFVLDNYGDCRGSGNRAHIGVDIGAARGQAVYATADGRLTYQFTNTGTAGYGWTLKDDDGNSFRYFHLDGFAEGLEQGDVVRFGDVIGYVGSTGNFIYRDGERIEDRNNIHLHFEVHLDGQGSVDPLPLLEVPSTVRVWSSPDLKDCSGLL